MPTLYREILDYTGLEGYRVLKTILEGSWLHCSKDDLYVIREYVNHIGLLHKVFEFFRNI